MYTIFIFRSGRKYARNSWAHHRRGLPATQGEMFGFMKALGIKTASAPYIKK